MEANTTGGETEVSEDVPTQCPNPTTHSNERAVLVGCHGVLILRMQREKSKVWGRIGVRRRRQDCKPPEDESQSTHNM